MTTLTANVPRLSSHCSHKLPTSCRLTALPTCCACQDKRPHSSAYSKYIDGVGFVSQGTRQERYCWMCKEFWNARVAVSGIHQADTRIPHVPDQSVFLEKWYDWHRGYKIIAHQDGSEEYQTLLGETLSDVPPGYLPRTSEELRAGATSESSVNSISESRNFNRLHYNYLTTEHLDIDPEDRIFDPEPTSDTTDQPNISPANLPTASAISYPSQVNLTENSTASPLDIELGEAPTQHDHASSIRSQFQRVTVLRHEVQRLRAGVERVMSGLQVLGTTVPDSRNALQHTNNLTTRLGNLEAFLNNTANITHNPQQPMDDVMDWDGLGEESQRPANVNTEVTLGAQGHAHNLGNISTGGHFNSSAGLASYQSGHPTNTHLGNHHEMYTGGVSAHTLQLERHRLCRAIADSRSLEDQIRNQMNATETDSARLRDAINHREQYERELLQLDRNQQQLQFSQQSNSNQQNNSNRFSTPSRQGGPLWSSREEMERLGDEYESPISGLFSTWGGRYNAAEAQRQQDRARSEATTTMSNTAPEPGASGVEATPSERVRTVQEIRHELHREVMPSLSRSYDAARRRARSNRNLQQAAGSPLQNPTTGPAQRSYLSTMVQDIRPGRGGNAAETNEMRLMRHRLINAETRVLEQSRRSENHLAIPPPPGRVQPHTHYPQQVARPGSQAPPVFTFPGHRRPQETSLYMRDLREESRAELMARRVGAARHHGLTYDSEGEEFSNSDIERLLTTGFGRRRDPEPPKSLDKDDGRPEPVSEENMMVKMECKICFTQVATVALLPCGHCVMCKWCADEAVPSHKLDQTAPASTKAQCPVCRRRVKQKAVIYGGETKNPTTKS